MFSDFGTIALCTRFKANRDSKGMAPAAWHIPESYPILDTEKRNNPWELVMEKVFVYRLPDDILTVKATPHNGARRSGQCFDPSECMENAGILDVFPIFHTARLRQKIR